MRLTIAFLLMGLVGLAGGCAGLDAPNGQGPEPGNGMPPDGDGAEPDGNGAGLAVTLRVSNPTPQPNEEVFLTCALVSGGDSSVRFDFQPSFGRLIVDHDAGTARFIVQESDVGVALTFTCTATNASGTGERSNSQTIVVSP